MLQPHQELAEYSQSDENEHEAGQNLHDRDVPARFASVKPEHAFG